MTRLSRTLLVVATVGLTTAFMLPGSEAGAQSDARDRGRLRLHAFEGSCSVAGTVTFNPGATFVQQILTLESYLSGTCNGTLDGQPLADAPVTMHNSGQSSGSCVHAETISPGPGTMTFADGTTIEYTFEFNWVTTDGILRYLGEESGVAVGHGTFRDPLVSGGGSKCATTGVTETAIFINLATQSPLVSDECNVRAEHSNCRG